MKCQGARGTKRRLTEDAQLLIGLAYLFTHFPILHYADGTPHCLTGHGGGIT
jgi:hypothetical protein